MSQAQATLCFASHSQVKLVYTPSHIFLMFIIPTMNKKLSPLMIMQTSIKVLVFSIHELSTKIKNKIKNTSFSSSTNIALFAFLHRSAQDLYEYSIQSAFM